MAELAEIVAFVLGRAFCKPRAATFLHGVYPMSFCETVHDARAPDWVPPEFAHLFEQVMSELPALPDRRKFAAVWGDRVNTISYRTIEAWPLSTRRLNGRCCYDRREIVEYGFRRLLEPAVVRGGHRANHDTDQIQDQPSI